MRQLGAVDLALLANVLLHVCTCFLLRPLLSSTTAYLVTPLHNSRDNLLVHRCVRRLYDSLNTSALKNALRPRNAYVGLPYISSSLIFIFSFMSCASFQ